MRYFVYISESKIKMLFSQVAKSDVERLEEFLGFDLKILKGEMKETRGFPANQFAQLNEILNKLGKDELIGSLREQKPFIKSSLKMTWASFGFKPDTPITFWSYFSRNVALGLAGSKHNLIGEQPSGIVHSYSRTDSIIYYLRNELENALPQRDDNELPSYARTESFQNSLESQAAGGIWEAVQLPGERETFDFVAKVLFRTTRKFKNQSWSIILATPLYVALDERDSEE